MYFNHFSWTCTTYRTRRYRIDVQTLLLLLRCLLRCTRPLTTSNDAVVFWLYTEKRKGLGLEKKIKTFSAPRGTGNNTRMPVSRSRSRSGDDKLRYTEWYLPRNAQYLRDPVWFISINTVNTVATTTDEEKKNTPRRDDM